MLLAYDRLLHTPVMSLQTGAELARTNKILIDPRDLTIIAYELDGPMLDEHPSFLRPVDVRELSNLGFIVDSSDEFVGLGDVIKIKEVHGFGFDVIGLDVIDDKKKKLGKVSGYNVDSGSFSVQQFVVKRPLLKSFGEAEMLIHRSQVIEVHDSHLMVRSPSVEEPVKGTLREYTNPFRTAGSIQPEAVDFDET
jgi:sporulation protein YlmC with PRC-barrel domain